MNYIYHADCHELWTNTAAIPPHPFSIQLRCSESLGIEQAFVISKTYGNLAPIVILPDISTHLVMAMLPNQRPTIRLIGPRTTALTINRQTRFKTLMIRFHPTALANYLPFPVKELTDRSIALHQLIGQEQEEILVKSWQEDQPIAIFDKLIKQLETLMPKSKRPNMAFTWRFLQLQKSKKSSVKVGSLARDLGLSERYLQRIVRSQTGLSPKMALRILRFRESLIARQDHGRTSWSGIAHMAGYFDQSHMIDEYQRFLGESPDRFFYG